MAAAVDVGGHCRDGQGATSNAHLPRQIQATALLSRNFRQSNRSSGLAGTQPNLAHALHRRGQDRCGVSDMLEVMEQQLEPQREKPQAENIVSGRSQRVG